MQSITATQIKKNSIFPKILQAGLSNVQYISPKQLYFLVLQSMCDGYSYSKYTTAYRNRLIVDSYQVKCLCMVSVVQRSGVHSGLTLDQRKRSWVQIPVEPTRHFILSACTLFLSPSGVLASQQGSVLHGLNKNRRLYQYCTFTNYTREVPLLSADILSGF